MEQILNQFTNEFNTGIFSLSTILLRIILAFIAGFIFGLEREFRMHAVGLRTLILITVASTVLMMLSIYIASLNPGHGDPARIAAQVVSGIGFLGGGAILRHGLNIRGLTSAAIIWAAAAIGLTIGAGLYIISFSALLICILSLITLEKFEERFFPAEQHKQLQLTIQSSNIDFPQLIQCITNNNIIINNTDYSQSMNNTSINIVFTVSVPDKLDVIALTNSIKEICNLSDISIHD